MLQLEVLDKFLSNGQKSLGCKVIGTVGSDEKISIAKKNGCDFVINYSKEDFARKVLEFTKDQGVSAVYDGVGKNTLEGSIECLKTRGIMISFWKCIRIYCKY